MELWKELWLALKGQLPAALAATQDRLDGCLCVELAPYTDFFHWAWDFIPHNWRWIIGLACGCCIILTFHRWTRYWDLFPFNIWQFLFKFAHHGVTLISSISNVEKLHADTCILLPLSLSKTQSKYQPEYGPERE
jgi:hypothetical protein